MAFLFLILIHLIIENDNNLYLCPNLGYEKCNNLRYGGSYSRNE